MCDHRLRRERVRVNLWCDWPGKGYNNFRLRPSTTNLLLSQYLAYCTRGFCWLSMHVPRTFIPTNLILHACMQAAAIPRKLNKNLSNGHSAKVYTCYYIYDIIIIMLSTACCCPVSGQTMCSYIEQRKFPRRVSGIIRSVRGDQLEWHVVSLP